MLATAVRLVADADSVMAYDVPIAKAIVASVLCAAIKADMEAFEGMAVYPDHLQFRRLTGEFTPAEQAVITTFVTAHDAARIMQERHVAAEHRSIERKKHPAALTLPERVARIEAILNIEKGG